MLSQVSSCESSPIRLTGLHWPLQRIPVRLLNGTITARKPRANIFAQCRNRLRIIGGFGKTLPATNYPCSSGAISQPQGWRRIMEQEWHPPFCRRSTTSTICHFPQQFRFGPLPGQGHVRYRPIRLHGRSHRFQHRRQRGSQ